MARIVLVGNMKATENAFVPLSHELARRGHSVVTHLYSRDAGTIVRECEKADLVCTGMASSDELAFPELLACGCGICARLPVALYADLPGSWRRPHFQSLMPMVNCLFVTNELTAMAVRGKYGSLLHIVASGNPEFEGFFSPKFTREEVRSRLGIGDESLIFSPRGKSVGVNTIHWQAAIEAAIRLGRKIQVVLGLHPRDPEGKDGYSALESLAQNSGVQVRFLQGLSSSELLPGIDLMVSSASTLDYEAACLRIPVITFFSKEALERRKKDTGETSWEPCESGISHEIKDSPPEVLANAMKELLENPETMQKLQEEVYPKPPAKGAAVRIMAEYLAKLGAGA